MHNRFPSPEAKKVYVNSMFDQISGCYDRFCGWSSFGMDARWRRRLAASLDGCRNILDLCTGTGAVARALSHRRNSTPRRIVGVDFSLPMVVLAAAKEEGSSSNENTIRYALADAESLPFLNHTFDGISCAFSFRNIARLDEALREIYRVLRPGGKLAVLDLTRPRNPLFQRFYFSWMGTITPAIGKLLSGTPDPFQYLRQSILDFQTPQALIERMRGAGFSSVTHQTSWGGVLGFFLATR